MLRHRSLDLPRIELVPVFRVKAHVGAVGIAPASMSFTAGQVGEKLQVGYGNEIHTLEGAILVGSVYRNHKYNCWIRIHNGRPGMSFLALRAEHLHFSS